MSVNPLGIRCFEQPFKILHQFIRVAFMRFCTSTPIFKVSNILVFLYVKPSHSHFVREIYSHILQIDYDEENARSLYECVQAQRERERKKTQPEITLFLNDVHTETMGRRSD